MKNLTDYSKPVNECAADELRRRFRDPVTGAKAKGHRNGQTDKRFTKRAAFVALGTKALVELAQAGETQAEQPTAEVEVPTTIVVGGERFTLTWVNDIPVLVSA
jgi:hypothetical protein